MELKREDFIQESVAHPNGTQTIVLRYSPQHQLNWRHPTIGGVCSFLGSRVILEYLNPWFEFHSAANERSPVISANTITAVMAGVSLAILLLPNSSKQNITITCMNCKINNINTLLLLCGHTLCNNCANTRHSCPWCGANLNKIKTFYLR